MIANLRGCSYEPFKSYHYSKNGKRKVKIPGTSKFRYKDVENADSYKTDSYRGIYITADGMGGYEGAKIASQHATLYLYNELLKVQDLMKRRNIEEQETYNLLEAKVIETNELVCSFSNAPRLGECGTTMDGVLTYSDSVYGAHVGDGSVFKIDTRNNSIELLTKTDKGITNNEGLSDIEYDLVNFAIVSNPLGRENLSVQTYSTMMNDSDIILMVTDGLTKKVHPEEILSSFLGKDFMDGVQMLRQYCRRPDRMRDIITDLSKRYDIDTDRLFHDDTTFIAFRRNEQYGR